MVAFDEWYAEKMDCLSRHNVTGPIPTLDLYKGLYEDECRQLARHEQKRARLAPQHEIKQLQTKAASLDDVLCKTLRTARNMLDRIEKLERRPILKYVGVWRAGAGYLEGECVTHQGSLWYCHTPTSAKPGTAPLDWQLCVKAGRSGRDRTKVA